MKRINFNDSWNFHKDGSDVISSVTLPHDAMIHDERTPDSPGKDANAYFAGGTYIYEKTFLAPLEWERKHIELAFGGVYRNTSVYLNGVEICKRPYGYVPFLAVLDRVIKIGEKNCLRVVADNSKLPNSRWYSGGGIYRDVELLVGGDAYIPWGGVKIETLAISPEPLVKVSVELGGASNQISKVGIEILDDRDHVVAEQNSRITDRAIVTELKLSGAKLYSEDSPELYFYRVTLRDINNTELDRQEGHFGIRLITYDRSGFFINRKRTCLKGACIHHDNGVIGAVSIYEVELRKIGILKESGYNAIRMSHHPASEALLRACDELGMYVMDEYSDMWFKNKNPYDYALDFSEWHERDITNMVKQDRNHPSVIMYSIGNELSEPASEEGLKVANEIIDLFHRLDYTRPVTGGINSVILMMSKKGKGIYDEGGLAASEAEGKEEVKSGKAKAEKVSGSLLFNRLVCKMGKLFNGLSATNKAEKASRAIQTRLDIAGYNYGTGRYLKDAKLYPDRVMVGTETYNYEVYDTWKKIAACPAVIGDFMWTGWDYIGEAAIGTWNYDGISVINACYPWLLGGTGAIDITGYPDAQSHYARITWADAEGLPAEPYIGVRPPNHPGQKQVRSTWRGTDAIDSWSWNGCRGNKVTVEVYSPGDYVNLYLNDKLIGHKKLKKLKCIFQTRYEEGCLRAEIRNASGDVIAEKVLKSAHFEDHELPRAVLHKEAYSQGRIEFYRISLEDTNGLVESNMDRMLNLFCDSFEYEGRQISGAEFLTGKELLGFGAANPKSAERFDSGSYTTYHGRAFVVVRKIGGTHL